MLLTTTRNLLKSNTVKGLSKYLRKYGGDREINLLMLLENHGMRSFFLAFKAAKQDRIAIKKIAVMLAIEFSERAVLSLNEDFQKSVLRLYINEAKKWLFSPIENVIDLDKDSISPISKAAATCARSASIFSGEGLEGRIIATMMSVAWCCWSALSASEIIRNEENLSIGLTAMAAYTTALWAEKALGQMEIENQIKIINTLFASKLISSA